MSEASANKLNLTAMSIADVVRLLTLVGEGTVTLAMVEADIAKGAPTNTDGTMSLIHYAAWLVRELAHGD